MRVTVCELPHDTEALDAAWAALCEHTIAHGSQLVLLPEFAMVGPIWEFEHFDAAAEPLVKQFSEYEPLPGLRVNGRLTRTENVADLAGLTAAFEAYRKSLGAKATDKNYVHHADREFFIAFAQAFRTKMNETAMRAQLASDHAPETYRFDTVRNIDAWYDAFDVVFGQRLYVEPRERARIW